MPRPSWATVSTTGIFAAAKPVAQIRRRPGNIRLVERYQDGRFPLLQLAKDAFLEFLPTAGVDDQNAHVGAVEHLPGFLHPLVAQRPASSIPAVSINNTGPSGNSSIGFSTGSVVVPATSDTIETSCRTSAFKSDDLPALRRPNRPMCRRRLLGVDCIVMLSFYL